MKRAACMASLLLLAASLAIAADVNKEVIRAAVRAAVTPKPNPPPQQQQQRRDTHLSVPNSRAQQQRYDANSVPRTIAARVVENGRPSDSHRHHRYRPTYGPSYCTSFIDCPFGSPGAPTFEELRASYRNIPDSELWNICLGRRAAPFFFYGRQGACMMLASPNPWRPVDLPRQLERDQALSTEEIDLLDGFAEEMNQQPGEGEIVDESTLPPCEINETLNRKRPQHACNPNLPEN
jgi:hypothetical protein